METLIVIVIAVLAFVLALGFAFGALDLFFRALVPMKPAFAPNTLPVRARKQADSLVDA